MISPCLFGTQPGSVAIMRPGIIQPTPDLAFAVLIRGRCPAKDQWASEKRITAHLLCEEPVDPQSFTNPLGLLLSNIEAN